MATGPVRIEHDSLGEVEVRQSALWGAQTERGRANFAVSGYGLATHPELIAALAQVKAAAARANASLGVLAPDVAGAIVAAAREVAAGAHDAQFPLDLVQGGGGTASNMNANEVIANRAEELLGGVRGRYERVHPNDHVNRSQSTNDVYPTALQLAVLRAGAPAVRALHGLADLFDTKSAEFDGLDRLGRTCLQDAVPLTAGETHRSHSTAMRRSAEALRLSLDGALAVPLGATAIGTGIGAPAGYRRIVVPLLAEESGLPVVPSADLFDALAHLDQHLAIAQRGSQGGHHDGEDRGRLPASVIGPTRRDR